MDTTFMKFIGLDLAWSARNKTGAAVIGGDAAGGELLASTLLHGDDEIVAFVLRHAGDHPALVTIDAPLSVPNTTGRRPAEAEIGAAFGRYHLAAYPANRTKLAVNNVVRGEALVDRLAAHGFVHHAEVTALEPVRQIVEVYPHPAMLAFFDLGRPLPYKARPHRTLAARHTAFRQFQTLIKSLEAATPALAATDELLAQNVHDLGPAALKRYEDQLDGVMCAYIGHYLWRWGMARARVFGNMKEGYITTPVPTTMNNQR
jgi:predicted RNase H-like nuclease